MIVSAYSNRIYKNIIGPELQQMLTDCNDIKIKLYSDIINHKVKLEDVNTTYVTANYHINCYYANIIIRDVKTIIKEHGKLQQVYLDDYDSKIETQIAKIAKLEEKLQYWQNMKQTIIAYDKQYKVVFPYIFKGEQVIHSKDKNTYNLYEFELYIDKRVKQIKGNIHNAKNKLNRFKQKQTNMREKTPVCCFGSKSFFKKQWTVDKYIDNHKLWKAEYALKRHFYIVVSGNKNYPDGSQCVRYNNANNILFVMLHKHGIVPEGRILAKQEWFSVPVKFKYREQEYLENIAQRKTTAYEIIDKGDYFIIKAVFDYENTNQMIDEIAHGVCSIDINVDRYALTEIDYNGNLLRSKVIYFDLENKTSNQAAKILEQTAIEAMQFCLEANKPLVREDIKKIKFKNTNDSKKNKQLTQFAYDKMINTIDRCFYKNNIQVYKTNPAYTSQQGKIKYMAQLGLSIHESAAFCIGRRYMFSTYDANGKCTNLYYENMNQYSKFGSIKTISQEFKKLSINSIYRLKKIPIELDEYKKLNQYIKAVNNYIYS